MAALKRSALGRGLDALITMDDLKTGGSSSISEIELSKIQPNPEQPRSVFEEETLEELATSIRFVRRDTADYVEGNRPRAIYDHLWRTPLSCVAKSRFGAYSRLY